MSNIIVDIGNSDLVNSLANISQFINVWQSTKGATYSQLATEIINQNKELENVIDNNNNKLLDILVQEIKTTEKQNEEIIEQNNQIIEQNNQIINILKNNGDYNG